MKYKKKKYPTQSEPNAFYYDYPRGTIFKLSRKAVGCCTRKMDCYKCNHEHKVNGTVYLIMKGYPEFFNSKGNSGGSYCSGISFKYLKVVAKEVFNKDLLIEGV